MRWKFWPLRLIQRKVATASMEGYQNQHKQHRTPSTRTQMKCAKVRIEMGNSHFWASLMTTCVRLTSLSHTSTVLHSSYTMFNSILNPMRRCGVRTKAVRQRCDADVAEFYWNRGNVHDVCWCLVLDVSSHVPVPFLPSLFLFVLFF